MSALRGSPSLRPARRVVLGCACLVALVGVALVGAARARAQSFRPGLATWAPASTASGRVTALVGTLPRDTWRADWAVRCVVPADVGGPPDAAPSRQTRELLELVRYVRSEPELGAPLLDAAWDQGVPICLDDRPEGLLGAYDLDHGLVVLNEVLTLQERAVVLVHELRHVEATARGFRPSLAYAMADTVRFRLALEADAQAVATLYAWKAAELGDAAAWRALSGLDRHADVAAAFERSLTATGSAWLATQAAFRAWYASQERVDAYRRNACLAYLDAVDASKAVRSYEPLPAGALDGLGRLPGGRDYVPRVPVAEAQPAEGDVAGDAEGDATGDVPGDVAPSCPQVP